MTEQHQIDDYGSGDSSDRSGAEPESDRDNERTDESQGEGVNHQSTDDARPPQCLSFVVGGPWGHFRRIEGNIVKQTYRIPPRTTVAGLLAGVLGIERDGYYDRFGADVSAIAVEPRGSLRTINMPTNTLSTAKENLTGINTRGKVSIRIPDPDAPRQQHNYEVLVDPEYRIDIWIDDDATYDHLHDRLRMGESHYVPSLGLSEHLATIEFVGECQVTPGSGDRVEVDSAVPNPEDAIIAERGVPHRYERSPGFMTASGEQKYGRTTTDYVTYAYNPEAGPLTVDGLRTSTVTDPDGTDRRVRFV